VRAHEIPDSGLRLAILNALLELDHLDEETVLEVLEGIDGEDEDEQIAAALERLARLEVPNHALAKIERLDFDCGNDIYMAIEQALGIDTGGETDHYQLGSLAGIERLTSLCALDLDGHGYREAKLDLAPLRGHPSLEKLTLSGPCTNVAVLESLTMLTTLDIRLGSIDDEAVLRRLAAQGVEVQR
jgi:hypothetical protein